ncbi:MAG TPA: alpha/beta hydrolase, partial [Candidatus Ozemobacteraceae bacterium]|nr:alpha/beta hydrolase [Candidatus Ozemobacteraceae bacterium]
YILFFPVRLTEPPVLPALNGRTFEHVTFPADDGTLLTGIWMSSASQTVAAGSSIQAPGSSTASRPVILFSHGNAGNLVSRLPRLVEAFAQLPVDVLVYDYRGYGRSGGRQSISGLKSDIQGAISYLKTVRSISIEKIILYGESLGGGVAVAGAETCLAEIGGIVVESGFRSLKARAGSRFPHIGPLILSEDMASDRTLSHYEGPLLIIHSRDDGVIPFSDGKALFDACPSRMKRMCELRGVGHNDPVWQLPEYLAAWREFLAASFPGAV